MQLCLPSNVEQHIILVYPYQGGKDLVIRGEREVLMRELLKKWNIETNHLTALCASPGQCMGTVGTVRTVPALEPAQSFHVHV